METLGVKDTKECLLGLLKITALMASVFKDGIQAQDITVVLTKIIEDEKLKELLLAAYNDIDKVPSEVKDMSLPEAIELMTLALPEVLNIVMNMKA